MTTCRHWPLFLGPKGGRWIQVWLYSTLANEQLRNVTTCQLQPLFLGPFSIFTENNLWTTTTCQHRTQFWGSNPWMNHVLQYCHSVDTTKVNHFFILILIAGGYAFFETSQLPNVVDAANTVSAMMISPMLESTGSKGFCVNFRLKNLICHNNNSAIISGTFISPNFGLF